MTAVASTVGQLCVVLSVSCIAARDLTSRRLINAFPFSERSWLQNSSS